MPRQARRTHQGQVGVFNWCPLKGTAASPQKATSSATMRYVHQGPYSWRDTVTLGVSVWVRELPRYFSKQLGILEAEADGCPASPRTRAAVRRAELRWDHVCSHQHPVSRVLLTQSAAENTEAPESISRSPGGGSEVGSEASLPAGHTTHRALVPGGNVARVMAGRLPPLVLLGLGRLGALPKVMQQGQTNLDLKPSALSSTPGWGGRGG